ncbi:MAG: M20/M25/M40 family metallo-hydrolase [bacterium]|nr:M20/M25/M40 family metallo-hydrolase [bacterium]MDY2829869.1 M20/M25/M40 family metallo-hydrolase [Alphaproteobacteria bacterium]
MKVIEVAQELMRFRTETGNEPEIKQAMAYIKNMMTLIGAKVDIFEKKGIAPVIFIRNTSSPDLDALCLGHIDVVPAADKMFKPVVKGGKLYGRGSLDMKSFAAVALNSMQHIIENKLPLKFGVILSSDEETGSKGTKAFLEKYAKIKSHIVLDNDVGGDITKIIAKCKNPVFVKIKATGKEAHGSCPWDGIDANEKMLAVLSNIRKFYPAYDLEGKKPRNKWVDTLHFAKINGGKVSNIISDSCEALCDFRLIETSSVEGLKKNLDKSMIKGVTYEIVSSSIPVVMNEKDTDILAYKKIAEAVLNKKIKFEYEGGATDAREFAARGSTVIMHSGTGEGMHAAGEYVEVDSVEKLAEIQIRFLEKLALAKGK